MRLTQLQIQTIIQVVSHIAGMAASIYLFGSRLNDKAKGGDVDILIETEQKLSRIDQGEIKMELEQALGLPVDILVRVKNTEPTPFQAIVQAHAARIETNP